MKTHSVTGGGGLRLHVREGGAPGGRPILFLHGWSQHHLAWSKQLDSPLAERHRLVAIDLRGHGASDAPMAAEAYTDSALWAEDVAAVIAELGLEAPVLVGWSYGGLVIGDYLARYGEDRIGGIALCAATARIGERWFGTMIGPGFLETAPVTFSEDQPTAIGGVQAFLDACFAVAPAPRDRERAMGWMMLVPPQIRAALIARELDHLPVYAALTKPVLVSFGRADTLVLPAMAEAVLEAVPRSTGSAYEGVGHAPQIEAAERYTEELGRFAAGL